MFVLDYELDCRHCEIIQDQYPHYVQEINSDPMANELLQNMYCQYIIEAGELRDLVTIDSPTRRNQRILSTLNRKSFQQFRNFLLALDETGQRYIICPPSMSHNFYLQYLHVCHGSKLNTKQDVNQLCRF